MLTPASFLTRTLRENPRGQGVARILAAAIHAVAPDEAVRRFVQRQDNILHIAGQIYDLDSFDRVFLVGLGKAALSMAQPFTSLLPDRLPRGLLIPKHPAPPPWYGIEIIPGGHPLPDENSLRAGARALALAQSLTSRDLVICLISGGGSALMSAPHPGLHLEDLQALTRSLLACGARIDEINTLRRHLDQVKGGGLARAAAPARVVSLILSDVVGNPLEAIASGPTAPDPSTRAEAQAVLAKYSLTNQVPVAILEALARTPETPKPGEALFERVQNVLVGSNLLAARAALAQAEAEGYQTVFLGDAWQGEARDVAVELCDRLKAHSRAGQPVCLVAGGETTVTLHGRGRGGRNQELALAAVSALAGLENTLLVTLATDGEDGPTGAAGAVVSGNTLGRARRMGFDPAAFLDDNNAYAFFDALEDLLKPGPTGTNVNDLTFLMFQGADND